MFSARVAQKPTIAVSDGTKTATNSAVVAKRLGCARIGPRPPERSIAQPSSASPDSSRNGAAHASSALIAWLPRRTTHMFSIQNAPNPMTVSAGDCHTGTMTPSIVAIASPPIQA
jgi:hypothetical protein